MTTRSTLALADLLPALAEALAPHFAPLVAAQMKATSDVHISHTEVGSRPFQRQVRAACKAGEIDGAFKVGSLWHMPRASFEAWKQKHRVEPRRSPAANDVELRAAAPSPARPAPSVAQTSREARRTRLGLAGGTR